MGLPAISSDDNRRALLIDCHESFNPADDTADKRAISFDCLKMDSRNSNIAVSAHVCSGDIRLEPVRK